MTELRYDPLARFREDGEGLLAAAERAGLDAPVPWCPGWAVRDLVYHAGEVWHFWAHVVDNRVTPETAEQYLGGYTDPPVPPDDELLSWARAEHGRAWRVLGWGDPDQPLWTWVNAPGSVAWVRRRMAQETAVHRWDAGAASGSGWRIDPVVAADGIDEFFQFFMAGTDKGPSVGGTVHLHCTDEGLESGTGEWIVHEVTEAGARFDREHTKGDCAVRGAAHDLLLWLWRRPATVDVIGDAGVAERFVNVARNG